MYVCMYVCMCVCIFYLLLISRENVHLDYLQMSIMIAMKMQIKKYVLQCIKLYMHVTT